jgi:glycerol uptake facilitator-like aquaporin
MSDYLAEFIVTALLVLFGNGVVADLPPGSELIVKLE